MKEGHLISTEWGTHGRLLSWLPWFNRSCWAIQTRQTKAVGRSSSSQQSHPGSYAGSRCVVTRWKKSGGELFAFTSLRCSRRWLQKQSAGVMCSPQKTSAVSFDIERLAASQASFLNETSVVSAQLAEAQSGRSGGHVAGRTGSSFSWPSPSTGLRNARCERASFKGKGWETAPGAFKQKTKLPGFLGRNMGGYCANERNDVFSQCEIYSLVLSTSI